MRTGHAPHPLYERIYAMVDAIPVGCVATYGQVALEAALPRRARLVGKALKDLPQGSSLPWHRVVNARGEISLRAKRASLREQKRRLRAEGVRFSKAGHIDLGVFGWNPDW